MLVTVYGAAYDLLRGLDHHVRDFSTDLAQSRLALAVYLLAGALDDAVALLIAFVL